VENILLEALKTSSIDFNIDPMEKKRLLQDLENTLRIVTNL